jgi:hypothetical protein
VGVGVIAWIPGGFEIACVVICRGPILSHEVDPGVPREVETLEYWVFGTVEIFRNIPTVARRNLTGQIKPSFRNRNRKCDAFHVLVRKRWGSARRLDPDAVHVVDPFSYQGNMYTVVAVPTSRRAARALAARHAVKT